MTNKIIYFNQKHCSIIIVGLAFCTMLFGGCQKDDELPADVSVKQQFLGSYIVEDNDEGDISSYNIAIFDSNKGNNVIEISNFGDLMKVNITANINGNKMTIPSQTFPNSKNTYTITLTGEGTLTGNVINYEYNFFVDEKYDDDWDFGGSCTATKLGSN